MYFSFFVIRNTVNFLVQIFPKKLWGETIEGGEEREERVVYIIIYNKLL